MGISASNTWFLGHNHLSQPPKRHLDRFGCFCTAHPCVQYTDQTDTQTTLRAIAMGHIYALHAGVRPKKEIYVVGHCKLD